MKPMVCGWKRRKMRASSTGRGSMLSRPSVSAQAEVPVRDRKLALHVVGDVRIVRIGIAAVARPRARRARDMRVCGPKTTPVSQAGSVAQDGEELVQPGLVEALRRHPHLARG